VEIEDGIILGGRQLRGVYNTRGQERDLKPDSRVIRIEGVSIPQPHISSFASIFQWYSVLISCSLRISWLMNTGLSTSEKFAFFPGNVLWKWVKTAGERHWNSDLFESSHKLKLVLRPFEVILLSGRQCAYGTSAILVREPRLDDSIDSELAASAVTASQRGIIWEVVTSGWWVDLIKGTEAKKCKRLADWCSLK
jgi:hypothetical protein